MERVYERRFVRIIKSLTAGSNLLIYHYVLFRNFISKDDAMQQEQQESYAFASYLVHLWKKRFLIVLGTIVCMALMAIYVQFVAKEAFRSFAQLMIKEPRKFTDAERDPISPVTYQYLLLNEDLVVQVRDEYARAVKMSPGQLKLEKFKTSFEITTDIIQDTTIKKEYSPVILLSADAGTPQKAKTLMEIWLKHFMNRYGDIISREADYTAQYYLDEVEKVKKALQEKEDRFLTLRRELPFKIRQLTSRELLLSPAPVDLYFQDQRRSYYKYRQQSNVEVALPELGAPLPTEGLEQELVDMEVDLAAAQAENDAPKIKILQAKKEALTAKIAELKTDIARLQGETAKMEKEFQPLSREVASLRDLHQYLADLKNQADVDAGPLHYSAKNDGAERMDVVILAKPHLPEMRVFPKKTFFCLIAGVVGFFLTCFVFIFDKFMKESRALLEERVKP